MCGLLGVVVGGEPGRRGKGIQFILSLRAAGGGRRR